MSTFFGGRVLGAAAVLWAGLIMSASATVVTIDDREAGNPGDWGAFDDPSHTWNPSNAAPGAINDVNTVAPLRETQDIRVTGDTTVNGDSFFLYRAFNKAPGTVGPTPVYIGVRVKQQSYAWSIQWHTRITAANPNWIYESPVVAIPTGTGYYDAIIPIPNTGGPTGWFAVEGSPTMGARDAHQTYGFASIELKATLPTGTGAYDMQFDQMTFNDNGADLPVTVSGFSLE